MDIIVTTPKSEMANSAKEAEDIKNAGGGTYFRRFNVKPPVNVGDRVFYVEAGFIRGYCLVKSVTSDTKRLCETTGRDWGSGHYVFMDAKTWKWIQRIPMQGFRDPRGWRPMTKDTVKVTGDWKMPRP